MRLRSSLYKRLFTIEREIPQGSNEDCVCVLRDLVSRGSERSLSVPVGLFFQLASISPPPSSFSMLEWYCPVRDCRPSRSE
jgi:hypothetical protein